VQLSGAARELNLLIANNCHRQQLRKLLEHFSYIPAVNRRVFGYVYGE
jgi:hypothetical protein